MKKILFIFCLLISTSSFAKKLEKVVIKKSDLLTVFDSDLDEISRLDNVSQLFSFDQTFSIIDISDGAKCKAVGNSQTYLRSEGKIYQLIDGDQCISSVSYNSKNKLLQFIGGGHHLPENAGGGNIPERQYFLYLNK